MSSAATRWALSRRLTGPLPAETRLVLVALAEYAGPDGRHAFPSALTLADELGVSERTVRRQLAQLLELSLIRRGDQRHVEHYPANRRPVVYDLDLEGGRGVMVAQPVGADGQLIARGDAGVTPSDPARGDATDTPALARGDTGRPAGVTPVSPKPRTNPTTTPLPPSPLEHARTAAGHDATGRHRVCGERHPVGTSCPELVPMPPGWRARLSGAVDELPDEGDYLGWGQCITCGGPSIANQCQRCQASALTAPTLDLGEMHE